MKVWVIERDTYTQIQHFTKYFPSKRYIFLVEVEKLQVNISPGLEYSIVVGVQDV